MTVLKEGRYYEMFGWANPIRSKKFSVSRTYPAFLRCHKSYLLNLAHVTGLEKNEFLLDDGARIPISATNLSRSKSAFLAWRAGTP